MNPNGTSSTVFMQIIEKCIFLTLFISYHKYINKLLSNELFCLFKVIQFLCSFFMYLLVLNNPKNAMIPLTNINLLLYWNLGLGCNGETLDQGRSYIDNNVSICHCFFSRYSKYPGDGGVKCIDGGEYSMNIIYTVFNYCSAERGGAIWFASFNSYLRMICANRCSASNYGHFSYLEASSMNQVEYLSASFCSHSISGCYSIELFSGDQRVDNTNSSMNNAVICSGILIISTSSFTSSYCTFSNNKVSNCICIYFVSSLGLLTMSYSNIVHNNSPNSFGVVYVDSEGSRKMMYCIFHDNQNY